MPPSRRNADPWGWAAIWQARGAAACLLYPFSLLFLILARLRRRAYRLGILRRERLPVPVVVVGNLTVGGAGKTPLVIHLAQTLRARGRKPGVVSRGYRGSGGVVEVDSNADPAVTGDEPLLLARRGACPVVVGRDRAAAARALLAAHPECDLILSDDGLQHYRLARNVEIAVFDARGAMNAWVLPAGPLREPLERLASVDAIVFNGAAAPAISTIPAGGRPVFHMRLTGATFVRADDPAIMCGAADFAGLRLHAVAGIGAPGRFFDHLEGLGLRFDAHAFPDHHAYRREELLFAGDAILTTEKDAVKLARLGLPLPLWVLPVNVHLSPDLAAFVLEKIDGSPPA